MDSTHFDPRLVQKVQPTWEYSHEIQVEVIPPTSDRADPHAHRASPFPRSLARQRARRLPAGSPASLAVGVPASPPVSPPSVAARARGGASGWEGESGRGGELRPPAEVEAGAQGRFG